MVKISTEENVLLPYEKCERYGAASLTDVELLAVIIRSGTKDKNCIQVAEELFKLSGNMGILGLKHLTQTVMVTKKFPCEKDPWIKTPYTKGLLFHRRNR